MKNIHIRTGQKICREINPVIKVLDATQGIVEYVASNEAIDSYNEIIRADGWRFNRFQKNAPFVDSHNYSSIDCLLGQVLDYRVKGDNLVETVKWAIDVPTNEMAIKGFAMTQAGYLKAVSVGFMPTRYCTKWDNDPSEFNEQCEELGLKPTDGVRCIYLQQEQLELSACVIGANPDAVARAYKAGLLDDAWLEKISSERAKRIIASSTDSPAAVEQARQRVRTAVLMELLDHINQI
jgi:hypothetical protein